MRLQKALCGACRVRAKQKSSAQLSRTSPTPPSEARSANTPPLYPCQTNDGDEGEKNVGLDFGCKI
jgi:hypothetical protein